MKSIKPEVTIEYLVASDFDQMLSFNDSGKVLANLLGVSNFEKKVTVLQELEQKLQMSPDCVI